MPSCSGVSSAGGPLRTIVTPVTTNSFPKLKGSKAKLFSCPVKRERPGSFGNFKDLRKELDSDLRRGRKFHYNELFWRQFRGEPEQV